MKRNILLSATLLLTVLIPTHMADAQTRERCFPETGHCVSGKILDYWEKNGGLAIFGYPITDLSRELVEPGPNSWEGPTQWFQRDRLEDHSNEGKGVLAGRLGALQLEWLTKGLVLREQPRVDVPAPGCRAFAETGHTMCGAFRNYWENNGGLMRFGYPLTEEFELTTGNWRGTVQYFERRRMELHTEMPGSPVLLGLLGRELQQGEPSASCPIAIPAELRDWFSRVVFHAQMGCPRNEGLALPVAEQYFQGGVMVWVAPQPGVDINGRIYALSFNQPLRYQVFADTWKDGMPEPTDQAPDGLRTPRRGFGKIWMENPNIRSSFGWATQPEQGSTGYIIDYSYGTVIWLKATNFAYAFGPENMVKAEPPSWR